MSEAIAPVESTAQEAAPAPAGGTPPVAPAESTPTQPPESVSKQFAMLTQREKQLQRQREEIAKEKAELDAKLAEWKAAQPKPKTPLESLEGEVTPDMLAKATKAEIEYMRKQWEEQQRAAQEAAKKQAEEQAARSIQAFKDEISEFVKGKPDDYELIALNNAQESVYHTVEQYYGKTGKVLSIKEASDLVEKQLEDELKALLAKSKKLKPTPPPSAEAVESKEPALKRTLNNGMTPQTPTFVHKSSVQDDAFQRALKALG